MTGFPNQFPWPNNSQNSWQTFQSNTQPNNNFLGQRSINNFGQTQGNVPNPYWSAPLNNAQPNNNFLGQPPSFPIGQMPALVDTSTSTNPRRIVKVKKERNNTNHVGTQQLGTNNSNNRDVPHSPTPPPSPKFENKEKIKREYPSSPTSSWSPTLASEDLSPAMNALCITPEQVSEIKTEFALSNAEMLFQHLLNHESDTEEYKIAFQLLKEMADSNDAQACNLLAKCYGDKEKNPIAAFKYFKKAADLDIAEACHSVAICYEDGDGVEKNDSMALEYFLKAANLGWALAFSRVGDIFASDGKYKRAASYYEQAIEDCDALYRVGKYYLFGKTGLEINIPKGLRLIKQSAEIALQANNYDVVLNCAEIMLGQGAQEGSSILLKAISIAIQQQNYQAALKLAKFASEKEDAEGHYTMGWLYFHGKTSQVNHRDYLQAIVYFRKADQQGNRKAAFYLGLCNEQGLGCPQNFALAVNYYQRAGLHKEALIRLAFLCANGQGIVQSIPMAIHLINQAKEISVKQAQVAREKANIAQAQGNAAQSQIYLAQEQKDLAFSFRCIQICVNLGHIASINELAICYRDGVGVAQNPEEAVRLFSIASNQGNSAATYNLGVCYDEGTGVEQNSHTALTYYAQVPQHEDARSRIAELILDGEISDMEPEEGAEYLLDEAKNGNQRAEKELKLRLLQQTNNNNNADSESEPSSES